MKEKFVHYSSPFEDENPLEVERNKFREQLLEHVESSLSLPANLVGEGGVAKVVALEVPGKSKLICAKYIDTSVYSGTIDYGRFGTKPDFNSLGMEASFLDSLREIDLEVKVPEPYSYWEKNSTENGLKRTKSFLTMELLDAVTIEDVINGNRELPNNFNFISFFEKLRRFIGSMHGAGVNHNDIHDKNVMIDMQTGLPRVIDFGSASKGTVGKGSLEWKPGNIASDTTMVSDDSGVNELERQMDKFLTQSKL